MPSTPEEFVQILTRKLEAWLRKTNQSQNFVEVLNEKMGPYIEDQDNQAILDEHCQRVWSDDFTPCRTPPDVRRKMMGQCKNFFGSMFWCVTNWIYFLFQRFLILTRSNLPIQPSIPKRRRMFTARFQRTAAIFTTSRTIRNVIDNFRKVDRSRSTAIIKTLCRVRKLDHSIVTECLLIFFYFILFRFWRTAQDWEG